MTDTRTILLGIVAAIATENDVVDETDMVQAVGSSEMCGDRRVRKEWSLRWCQP